MKKWVLLCILLLCIGLTTGAYAKEIKIPATAEAVMEQLPMELPPLPEITVDPDLYPQGTAYIIKGLDAWPIRDIDDYQQGVFQYTEEFAYTNGLKPIVGLENEPFAIVMPEDGHSNFVLNKSKLTDLSLKLMQSEVSITLRFGKDIKKTTSCTFKQNGQLSHYRFPSGKVIVNAYYDDDGLLQEYSYYLFKWEGRTGYIQFFADFTLSGDITSMYSRDTDEYYRRTGDQWYIKKNGQFIPGDPPDSFSEKTYPPATLFPAEDGERAVEKYESNKGK